KGPFLTGNMISVSSLLKNPLQFPVEWPVKGTLTREYNKENGHFGIDIAANKGTDFHAIADGVVIGKSWSLNYGYVLYIQHGKGIITVYKHASAIIPEIGALILKGDILGHVGNTGVISSGPHLHMEIWANGLPQNPLHYLIKS
ncbi:MAG TPA: M23 family metallopeptidase, partial [Balneolaceae bacterium]|nr:M23 family metallopeptidase [Balneolaceae bacterium]